MEEMKIILLGEAGVGKSALLHRFITGKFDETLPPTTQVECHSKMIQVDDKEIKVMLWDTVGQERFNALAASYFRKVEGVLLLYDVTDIQSFYALSSWIDSMRYYNEDAPILIVGNKNEEDPRRKAVNLNVIHNFVREGNFDNIEISVKTGENLQEAFLCLIRKIFMAKRAATAKKITAKGFSYLTEKEEDEGKEIDEGKEVDEGKDVIKLTKDANIQTEGSNGSWCSC